MTQLFFIPSDFYPGTSAMMATALAPAGPMIIKRLIYESNTSLNSAYKRLFSPISASGSNFKAELNSVFYYSNETYAIFGIILKIRSVFLWLKSSPSLNSNKISHIWMATINGYSFLLYCCLFLIVLIILIIIQTSKLLD